MLREFYPRISAPNMKQKLKASKTFMVVRDPFERILSAYRDKLEDYQRDLKFRDGFYYEHYGKFMVVNTNKKGNLILNSSTHTTETNIIRKEPTWREFVSYLLRTSVARYDEHWMPITRICSPCNVKYDAVIKLENLKDEIKTTLKHVNIDASNVGWAHRTGTSNKKTITNYFHNLTIGEVKKLYAKYKRDFQIFGYTPFKYFKMANKTP